MRIKEMPLRTASNPTILPFLSSSAGMSNRTDSKTALSSLASISFKYFSKLSSSHEVSICTRLPFTFAVNIVFGFKICSLVSH